MLIVIILLVHSTTDALLVSMLQFDNHALGMQQARMHVVLAEITSQNLVIGNRM